MTRSEPHVMLLAGAVIAVVAAAIFVAINPAERFAEARDARRRAVATRLVNAVEAYRNDHARQDLPIIASLAQGESYRLGDAATCEPVCDAITVSACGDIAANLVSSGYLTEQQFNNLDTDLYLTKNEDGTITVGACYPEASPEGIAVTR